jgi:S-adenosylmethionine decarboxylase
VCYTSNPVQSKEYIEYIDEVYNSDRLTAILETVAQMIGAQILNIARQDYEPQGASVTMLLADEPMGAHKIDGPLTATYPQATVAHLDKSHLTVHTYPEVHPENGICTFRADIDVSTCGLVSPLKALDFLIESFESDVVIIDYRVRGFTRTIDGLKVFLDHKINSIQDFICANYRQEFMMTDVNYPSENLYHTKMMLKDMELNNMLFGSGVEGLNSTQQVQIEKQLRTEMAEIFYARNEDS